MTATPELSPWIDRFVADNDFETLDYDADHGTLGWIWAEAHNEGIVSDDTLIWWIADNEGVVEGCIITVDTSPTVDGNVRYASLFQEWKYLMDREATGADLIRSFFERILDEETRLLKQGEADGHRRPGPA